MFRKALLPALAIAMLAGCVTDYTYRGGNGDYYYGRPQVEYQYIGGYGYGGYGAYGGYGYGGPSYYYDRFGRLVYGYPHRYYGAYGAPYSNNYWIPRPRPGTQGGHGDADHHDRDHGNSDRRPPWRNIGGMQPGLPEGRVDARQDGDLDRQPTPFAQPRRERPVAPIMDRGDVGGDGGARVGRGSSGGGERARVSATPEDEP